MIDRLHDALPYLEHLSPEIQEEAATYIEALVEALTLASMVHSRTKDIRRDSALHLSESTDVQWPDPFGAWSDLPDTVLDDLDQIRHASPPTPPLELP